MGNDLNKEILGGLPEAFYDVLAYIVPAVYLALSIIFELNIHIELKNVVNSFPKSWVFDLFAGAIVLGGLYILGQFITTLSFYLLVKCIDMILAKTKWRKHCFPDEFTNTYLKSKTLKAPLALEVAKRFARWIMTRNVMLCSIIALILSISLSSRTAIWVHGAILFLSAIDNVARRMWLFELWDKLSEYILENN